MEKYMIHSLNGRVVHKTPGELVVVCGGVGFYVMIPSSAYAYLPDIGQEGVVFTHLNVKDDAMELFGFATEQQRNTFRLLICVSGVCSKVALGVLSVYDIDSIALAIASGDHKAFVACQNVGPKLAQRIVLELKDKVSSLSRSDLSVASIAAGAVERGAAAEAVAALVSLGFSQSEAAACVARLPQDSSVEELIAAALRAMGSR
jgi:Holliday junction DNA helicase RuvA